MTHSSRTGLESLDEDQTATSIKCISLTQPYATLVALGVKKVETRSWRTWHRGPLLIHAAKAFPRWARDLCNREPFATALLEAGYVAAGSGLVDPGVLPLGKILAVCNLKHCVRIGTPGIDLPPPEPERSFGDYAVGRYAWMLSDEQPLPKPIAATGAMGLWVPDEDLLALLPEWTMQSAVTLPGSGLKTTDR